MELDEVLRSSSHRVTRPRRVVWQVLHDADRHLSVQEIAERVQARDTGVNVSSVYRSLTLFRELGLVRETRHDDASTWEVDHGDAVIHLVCERCGRVLHHDAGEVETLRRKVTRQAGFRADSIDVRVNGRCDRCVDARVPAATGGSGE